jgi:hypothetical protein
MAIRERQRHIEPVVIVNLQLEGAGLSIGKELGIVPFSNGKSGN